MSSSRSSRIVSTLIIHHFARASQSGAGSRCPAACSDAPRQGPNPISQVRRPPARQSFRFAALDGANASPGWSSLPHEPKDFIPRLALSLALSLPLGVVGHAEVAELEFNESIEPADILRRLRLTGAAGHGFPVRRCESLSRPRPGHVELYRIVYRTDLHPSLPIDHKSVLQKRCTAFLAASEVWAERERPRPRQINIRPYVDSLKLTDEGIEAIWLTPQGSARADELAAAVGIVESARIERMELELLDEASPAEAARTPNIEPQTRPLVVGPDRQSSPTMPPAKLGERQLMDRLWNNRTTREPACRLIARPRTPTAAYT